MKEFLKKNESLAVTFGILAAVSILALAMFVVPRISADVTSSPGSIIPATTLNLFNTQTITAALGFSNTVEIAAVPAGYLAVKREINIFTNMQLGVTNTAFTGVSATNTISGGCILTNSDGGTTGWILLSQTPYYDSSHIYGYSGVSNSACVFRTHIIAVAAPSPQGGNIPSGALGAGNIAVPQ